MFSLINKIMLTLVVLALLVVLNLIVGGLVASLVTAPSWGSITGGILFALFVLWLNAFTAVIVVKSFSNKVPPQIH